MKLYIFAIAAVCTVAGCNTSATEVPSSTSTTESSAGTSSGTSDYSDKGKQLAWIDQGKEAIRQKLRDPSSAEFRNVEFHAGGGTPVACGEVNANNGFGGKGGYERFLAAGDVLTVLESEMTSSSEFDSVWQKFCH